MVELKNIQGYPSSVSFFQGFFGGINNVKRTIKFNDRFLKRWPEILSRKSIMVSLFNLYPFTQVTEDKHFKKTHISIKKHPRNACFTYKTRCWSRFPSSLLGNGLIFLLPPINYPRISKVLEVNDDQNKTQVIGNKEVTFTSTNLKFAMANKRNSLKPLINTNFH